MSGCRGLAMRGCVCSIAFRSRQRVWRLQTKIRCPELFTLRLTLTTIGDLLGSITAWPTNKINVRTKLPKWEFAIQQPEYRTRQPLTDTLKIGFSRKNLSRLIRTPPLDFTIAHKLQASQKTRHLETRTGQSLTDTLNMGFLRKKLG